MELFLPTVAWYLLIRDHVVGGFFPNTADGNAGLYYHPADRRRWTTGGEV